jgi:two-component system, cell cycle sensor histidine kinase and response regulator CckA
MNAALRRMIRMPDCLSGYLRFKDLLPEGQHEESESLLHNIFSGDRESFQLENQINDSDGAARWVLWTGWLIPENVTGNPTAIIVAEDTTAQHESTQRLRQAESLEAVGRLAGGIAHDFNNLLTGVLLYCDLLLGALAGEDRLRKYAEEIRGAGMQASGLVRQLLSVARPGPAVPELVSLNEVAEGMHNLLTRMIGENIDLHLELDPHLGLVRIDAAQAQQILLNLALNARDAMPQGGQITIATGNCKLQVFETSAPAGKELILPCAMVVVSDTGTGMSEHVREHLFEAFFTTKTPGKGTGLGLATVHDLVTRSGGLIHVESAPEQGTRVSVLLPAVPETVLDPKWKTI